SYRKPAAHAIPGAAYAKSRVEARVWPAAPFRALSREPTRGRIMLHLALRAVMLATVGLSVPGLAHAQVGRSTTPDYDRIYAADRIDEYTRRELAALHKTAIEALEARNYPAAEATLGELAGRTPTTTDANFLLGLARIGLEKWD